jgi:uncharacterized membrane protein YkvI
MREQKSGVEFLFISFSIAAVWFSTHCGGGFATGNQEVNFYVKYGWLSAVLPFIAMFFVAWTYRNALVLAKDHNVHDYKSFANVLYHPYEKVFSVIFELCFMANILIAVSTSIAGAGSLLQNAIGVPYFLGISGIGIILLLLTIFGAELIIRVLRYKAYFLIVTLVLLAYLGLQHGADKWQSFIATKETFGNDQWEAVLKAALYVGFQSFGLVPAVSVSHKITTTKECNMFGVFGVLLNGTFLAVMCIMLLGFAPGVLKETLPVYYATNQLGIPWLKVVYSVILFVALIGTAISFVYTSVARFEKAWKGSGVFESLRLRRIVISVTTMTLCTGASVFGLTALVVKGYGSMGYVGLAFVVLPLLTVGTVKIAKNAALRKQQGIIES